MLEYVLVGGIADRLVRGLFGSGREGEERGVVVVDPQSRILRIVQ